jgi:tagatose kinase
VERRRGVCTVLPVVGEALAEVMRAKPDVPLDRPGALLGPYPSGAPAIFASVAARLGAPTEICAAVGDDPFGRMIAERLDLAGVGVRALRTRSDAPTGVAFVSYARDGGRSFVFLVRDSAAARLGADDLGDLPETAEWLHVSGSALALGEPLGRTVWQAIQRVRARGGVIGFDPNVRPEAMTRKVTERLRRVALTANVAFPSEGERELLGLDRDVLLRRGATVCTTCGALGVVVARPDGTLEVPAVRALEVDPTGAGDWFAAGFTAATLTGSDPGAAAAVGCAIAARCVETFGPMEAEMDSL